MNIDFSKLQTAAAHFGNAVESGLNTVIHIVEALAPVAEVVGVAIGQPEVTAAAKLAEVVAVSADKAGTTVASNQSTMANNALLNKQAL